MPSSADCLLEARPSYDRVLYYIHNAAFLVHDNVSFDQHDAFYDSNLTKTSHGDASTRDCTPAPGALHEELLRISMDSQPRHGDVGWIFGSGEDCDVKLDEDNARGVSAWQFGIRMQRDAGVFVIRNYSQHGTLMKFSAGDGGGLTEIKSQRAFGTGTRVDEVTVQVARLTIRISSPDHSSHIDDFRARWRKLYAALSAQPPSLQSLAVSAGPSSTHRSIEYFIDRRLGKGASGTVFRAVNRFTGQVHAVKRYMNTKDMGKEVSLLSQIHHDHIVKFVSYNSLKMELVLECIDGPTLREAHQQYRFNLMHFKIISNQILQALSYLHHMDFTHRDLKLENIIVQRWNPLHIKMIDLSVASDCKVMKTFAGTPYYMAPEIKKRCTYDSRADIWSLGIIDTEIFCGLPARSDCHPDELHLYIMLKRERGLHEGAVSFIIGLLEEDPDCRPTAKEALELEFLTLHEHDANIALPSQGSVGTALDTSSEELPDTWPWGVPHPSDMLTNDAPDIDTTVSGQRKRAQRLSEPGAGLRSIEARRRRPTGSPLDLVDVSLSAGATSSKKRHQNDAVTDMRDGYMALSRHGIPIYFHIKTHDINVTHLLKEGRGASTKTMQAFFRRHPGIQKRSQRGNTPAAGTYLKPLDARQFCKTHQLSLTPVNDIENYLKSL